MIISPCPFLYNRTRATDFFLLPLKPPTRKGEKAPEETEANHAVKEVKTKTKTKTKTRAKKTTKTRTKKQSTGVEGT